jgi:ribosome-interacting GTPase 1
MKNIEYKKDILKEEIKRILLEYTLDKDDIEIIKDIIRDEIAEVMRDL